MAGESKVCANRACTTPHYPIKGDYCTAGKCKKARAAVLSSKKMRVVGGAGSAARRRGRRLAVLRGVRGLRREPLGPVERRNELEMLVKFDKGIEKKVGAEKKAILEKLAAEEEDEEQQEEDDLD